MEARRADGGQVCYAHLTLRQDGSPDFERSQPLSDHLLGVGQKAASFGQGFGAADEARLAGWLHDMGKFREEFQRYLRQERDGGVDTHHAVYGAALAFARDWPGCAFAAAGHHAGLHDLNQLQALVSDPKYDAAARLPKLEAQLANAVGKLPSSLSCQPFLHEKPLALELYVRMVFSCLVDADFLDTEKDATKRARQTVRLADMVEQLLNRVLAERSSKPTEGQVNRVRHAIFEQCLRKGEQHPGFFSLTVPTGGGKTLSSMAFALAHAKRWNLEHVIVVIPYLSIIEQNAAEYRRVLDPDGLGLVVENHSAVPVAEGAERRERPPLELACENWDAPVIVTTSVQFIESLFASLPSRCRKLHNIARSVVILDEVQTLPSHLLSPLLSVIRELMENYGVSFLFMTATQPAFRHHGVTLAEGFKAGEVCEITQDTGSLFKVLQRVDYEREGELGWDALAQRMAALPQVLCVVNVRKHAFSLWEALQGAVPTEEKDSIFHLSSSMCAEHRLKHLGEIKDPREGSIRHRLKHRMPCRVVATQVVEAGVDVDFPVVFRALGPLDSIVQAGGRCNREGRLVDTQGKPVRGKVIMFSPQDPSMPSGVYRTATEKTVGFLDPLDSLPANPEIFARYFSQLFQIVPTDHSRQRETTIQEDRQNLRFREVSSKAKVIRDDGVPVVVPYRKGKEVIEAMRTRVPIPGRPRFDRQDLRSLQRFMVNVRTRDFQMLQHYGMVSPLLYNLELYVLEEGCYHEHLGLLIHQRPVEDLCGV